MRALWAVVQHGSTVRAAEAIHLSQPSVARAVVQLEMACGVPLFVRATRGMVPTPICTQLAARIEVLLRQLACGATEAQDAAAPAEKRPGVAERFPALVTRAHLCALVGIATCGSEAQAAAWLGITQPAVHMSLRDLEAALGIRLFYKLRLGTRLTPAGEALLRRVKLALAEIHGMETDIAARRGEIRGRVVVGTLPLSVNIFLPRAVQSLTAAHRDIAVHIVDGTYESLVKALLSADIDVIAGALRPDVPNTEVQHHHLFDDELVIVARTGHPCFARGPVVLEDLLDYDWVKPLPNSPADRALAELFRNQGLELPRNSLHASSTSMTRAFLVQTERLAMASRGQALLDDHGGHLSIVPLELPSTRRRIGLVTRALSAPSHDLRLFLDACHQAVRAL